MRSSHFYGLRNRTAERTAGGRIVCQNSAACLGRIGRRRRYIRVKGLHDGLAERLLLVGDLNHEYLQIQSEVRACLRECSTPLTGTGLGGDVGDALLLGVVGLGQGGVQFVGAGRGDALILEIDVGWSAEGGLKIVGSHKRSASVAGVLLAYRLGDRDPLVSCVEFLVSAGLAEDRVEILGLQGLVCGRIEDWHRLVGHDCLHVEPCCRDFALREQEFFLSHCCSFLNDTIICKSSCLFIWSLRQAWRPVEVTQKRATIIRSPLKFHYVLD